jgi:hypothetical protein
MSNVVEDARFYVARERAAYGLDIRSLKEVYIMNLPEKPSGIFYNSRYIIILLIEEFNCYNTLTSHSLFLVLFAIELKLFITNFFIEVDVSLFYNRLYAHMWACGDGRAKRPCDIYSYRSGNLSSAQVFEISQLPLSASVDQ